MTAHARHRRRLLAFLAASPLAVPLLRAVHAASQPGAALITAPDQALNVFDFEAVARQTLPPAHFGYLATGVDDDQTLQANREGFERLRIRVRRLVDVSRIDTSVMLFGQKWPTPIVLAPVGSQRAFHAEGELAVARAAREKRHLQILSTVASTGVEDVTAARGAPIWYQLYPTDQWDVTRGLVARAAGAGCAALVLTVDLQGGSNRETGERSARTDSRTCTACHKEPAATPFEQTRVYLGTKPMFRGLDLSQVTALQARSMTWDVIARLRDLVSMPLLVKGIVMREDADLAVKYGVDGIIVSNHGGRAEESGRATIESLVEVVDGARGQVPVLMDGGIRRGTDVFKALALGASAVLIGRPYVWGLAAFGQAGVEEVLDLLTAELVTIMRQAGTRSIAEIQREYVVG